MASSDPAYLKSLKRLGRDRWATAEDAVAAAKRLNSESDRGAIILAATTLEDMIEYRILAYMPNLGSDSQARKRLFEQDGAISSFSRKILVAYALGIIDKDYQKRIDLIREIRNTCAHSRHSLSLESQALREACEVLIGERLAFLVDREPATIRRAFILEIEYAAEYVRSGRKIETVEDRQSHALGLQGNA